MKKNHKNRICSVARTLEILGDRWLLLILREAFFGVHYYDKFQSNLGIATNILSGRLKTLVEQGIMKKNIDSADARRMKYRLTPKGLDLYSVTLALMKWGDNWLAGDKGPPLILYHKLCGNRLEPVMSCASCGKAVDVHDVKYEERSRVKK